MKHRNVASRCSVALVAWLTLATNAAATITFQTDLILPASEQQCSMPPIWEGTYLPGCSFDFLDGPTLDPIFGDLTGYSQNFTPITVQFAHKPPAGAVTGYLVIDDFAYTANRSWTVYPGLLIGSGISARNCSGGGQQVGAPVLTLDSGQSIPMTDFWMRCNGVACVTYVVTPSKSLTCQSGAVFLPPNAPPGLDTIFRNGFENWE